MLHAIIPSRTVNCGRGCGEVDVSVYVVSFRFVLHFFMVETGVAPPCTAEAGISRIRIRMRMVTTEIESVFVLHFFMVETGVAPPYTAEAGINRIRIRMRMVTTKVGSVCVFALSQPKLDPYFSHFFRVLAALQ